MGVLRLFAVWTAVLWSTQVVEPRVLAKTGAPDAAFPEPVLHPNASALVDLSYSGERRLQTSCTPSTSGGTWSGTPPDLTFCG
jgi:hypothetical protein